MTGWLTKPEVNSLYYNTVAGKIAFGTEATVGAQATAVGRLIALHAKATGKRSIRILEIAANDCAFERALLGKLRVLIRDGVAALDRIDYVAVEYARGSLEAAAAWEEEEGTHERVLRPPGQQVAEGPLEPARPTLVALLADDGPPAVNVGLVHAEANQFLRSSSETFDYAILNELLDDMPYRAYYADAQGVTREFVPHARAGDEGWTVRISAEESPDGPVLEPGTLSARSPESVEVVEGIARRLASGGLLLVHDYGFAGDAASVGDWASPAPHLPGLVTMEFPEGSEDGFPRSFFRVFGNEQLRVVQVTNDVNFAELQAALEGSGTVSVIAHGNAKTHLPGGPDLQKGDGVFLSEFLKAQPDDDLPALLASLHERQREFREAYVRDYVGGHGNVFYDLLYVKD